MPPEKSRDENSQASFRSDFSGESVRGSIPKSNKSKDMEAEIKLIQETHKRIEEVKYELGE